MVIQALVKCGVYLCDIARQLGVHPKTVSRALAWRRAESRRGARDGVCSTRIELRSISS